MIPSASRSTHIASATLTSKAFDGDPDALRDLFDSTRVLRSTQDFDAFLKIVAHFFRPENGRLSLILQGDSPTSRADKTWLDCVIQCILSLELSLKKIFSDNRLNPRLPVTPIVLALRSCWSTHILPAMVTVTELYILDDLQPTLQVGRHITEKYQAFRYVCDLAAILHDPSGGNMQDLMQADTRYPFLGMRLIVAYLDRYAYDDHGPSFALPIHSPALFQMDEALSEMLRNPRLIPSILHCYDHYSRRRNYTQSGVAALSTVLLIHASLFSRNRGLIHTIFNGDPTLIKLPLKIWDICLTQQVYYSKGRLSDMFVSERGMQDCLSSLVAIFFSFCSAGSCALVRIAIQNRFLQKIVLLLDWWKRTGVTNASSALNKKLADVSTALFRSLQPLLLHFSVLESASHAVKVMDQDEFLCSIAETNPKQNSGVSKAIGMWNDFKSLVKSARPVLEEYKTHVIGERRALCSYNKVI
jgi:hypothetical protein